MDGSLSLPQGECLDGHLSYPLHCACESRAVLISHGAVKLLITGVEETTVLASESVLHGDQGSPAQRKPQSPAGHSYPESGSVR